MNPSRTSELIEPFHVMEVVKKADALAREGRDIIHLSIGEPDFPMPAPIKTRLIEALQQQRTRYTAALGLVELRQAIAKNYWDTWGIEVSHEQIVVTSGASAALMYACQALINPGDRVLVTDPGYPCNKTFVQIAGGQTEPLTVAESQNFQPTPEQFEDALTRGSRGLILASPSNPTGTRLEQSRLNDLLALAWKNQAFVIMDEIYQQLVYGSPPSTIMQLHGAPSPTKPFVVINSFSKYFGMTGMRLGWMVMPPQLIDVVERLAQNLAICPNTPTQYAALACFEPATLTECERRRKLFESRRQLLMDKLPETGLRLNSKPDGAFYLYLQAPYSSDQYCVDLLEATGVCTVPGKDFSPRHGHEMFRISYANSTEQIEEALDRIRLFNARRQGA